MSRITLVKNIFANVCRGGATALVTIILPPFLTRSLSQDTYGTWLLILQLSTYVSLLDFGIQTAVGRFIAHYTELGDAKRRDSVVSTAVVILSLLGLIAVAGMAILAWQLPALFKDMPTHLHEEARLTLLFVGTSLAISLPFSVFGAVFIGLQRYDIPAWIIGSNKLFGGLLIVLVAQSSHSMIMMGIAMGISNLSTGLWQYLAYRKMAIGVKISLRKISKESFVGILDHCFAVSVASVGGILVSGLDTTVIGYFDYKSVVYYVLAASVTNFMTGIQYSILNTILPHAATISARGDKESIGKLLLSTTRYATIALVLTSLPILLGGRWMLTAWVGQEYALNTNTLLQLLVISNCIRQIGAPYAMIMMAVGEQRLIMLSPLVEGVVNLVVSIILVQKIGVTGVAIGTVVGGFVSIAFHLFYNLPRTKNISLPSVYPLLSSVGKPLISIVPFILFLPLLYYFDKSNNIWLSSIVCFAIYSTAVAIIYITAITAEEKKQFVLFIKQRITKSSV
jgi:O-antigen/teichoic acid export membrane protein